VGNTLKAGVRKTRKKKVLEMGPKAQNHDYTISNNKGSTFWMSLSDFTKYFYILTVCFANNRYRQSFIQDQTFSYKWGALELDMPSTEKDCFFSLF
jgi:hypothetical protein